MPRIRATTVPIWSTIGGMSHATHGQRNVPDSAPGADRVVVYGAAVDGGHTWTAQEHQAVCTIAKAITFTAIDQLRDAGWESEFEQHPIAAHDWKAIDEEVDRLLRTHEAVPDSTIVDALTVLARRLPPEPPAPVCPRCGTGRMMQTEDMASDARWLECSCCGHKQAWAA